MDLDDGVQTRDLEMEPGEIKLQDKDDNKGHEQPHDDDDVSAAFDDKPLFWKHTTPHIHTDIVFYLQ